jgi:hypothetical protein
MDMASLAFLMAAFDPVICAVILVAMAIPAAIIRCPVDTLTRRQLLPMVNCCSRAFSCQRIGGSQSIDIGVDFWHLFLLTKNG